MLNFISLLAFPLRGSMEVQNSAFINLTLTRDKIKCNFRKCHGIDFNTAQCIYFFFNVVREKFNLIFVFYDNRLFFRSKVF